MIPISRPDIGGDEKAAVLAVLDSGMLTQGEQATRLEDRFRQVAGTKHAVATSSGTTALHLALLAHGIGPGDEVITSAFTFIATPNSVLYTGARPVFADVEEDTFNIDYRAVEAAITVRTKAIMAVHLYGYPCDMEALCAIARRHDLRVIEDAAQALGATYGDRPVGGFGTGAFSLYATKNVTSAEGGVITTNDEVIAERARLLRNHGMARRYHHELLGYNFRMTDVHAAIGLAQIGRLDEFTVKRRRNAAYLSASIKSFATPRVKAGYGHCWHQYTVRARGASERDAAVKAVAAAGVGTGIFYPVPAHQHQYMRELAGDFRLPVTERLAQEVFSLPVHPSLTDDELQTIAREVNKL